MQTTSNAVAVEKADKAGEKVAEKRRALGRGLESLLPGGPRVVPSNPPSPSTSSGQALAQNTRQDGAPTAGEAQALPETGVVDLQAAAARGPEGQPVAEIAVDLIDHNPHQTRTFFEPEGLEELAFSIRVQGVIQPIVVRPEGTGANGRYILILGERRLRASKMAGKTTIPAIVKRVSEQQAAEMTIVENLQREDLECLEQAAAFAHLSREFSLTQEEIGKRVGVSRETVSNYLRLLKLPGPVQNYLRRGELTYSHARELLVLSDDSQILKLAELAVKKKMSVLQLEAVRMDLDFPPQPDGDKKPGGGARWVDPNIRAAQRNLEMILGMRVRIRDRKGKGKITIEYGTIDDYERVVGMLKGKHVPAHD